MRSWRKPLVILTPKGMLRAKAASSSLEQLTSGRFRPVIRDSSVQGAGRILLCTGKIAHELMVEREKRSAHRTAIVRLEQLYPFPDDELSKALESYPAAREVVWVQEEPANMGALSFVRPRLQRLLSGRHVRSVNRSESASPATGSASAHKLEQSRLLELALQPLGAR